MVILVTQTKAQKSKEGNIWYFGNKAGIDFNSGTPQLLSNGALNTSEGCATICNKYGNLLFYTDGISVYNKNHVLMSNGKGLKGHSSSTQSAVVVPSPSQGNIYYLFSCDGGFIHYSIVDTALQGGLGAVTTKNVQIMVDGTEKLNSAKSSDGKSFWVVSHQTGNNSFYAFSVDSTGVNTTPIISKVGSVFSSPVGHLKFSSDGQKIVTIHWTGNNVAEVFDFDNSTGVVSNAATLINSGNRYYGAEFSPSGRYLYVAYSYQSQSQPSISESTIYQFDMSAGNITNIINSRTTIVSSTLGSAGAMQLAPDGKIYIVFLNRVNLGVIHKPEGKGLGCNFVRNGLNATYGTPGFGLPNFNQSFFYKPNVDIDYDELKCDSLNVRFFNIGDTDLITKSYWDFGDNTKDSGELVTKVYQNHGVYTLTNIVHTKINNTVTIDTLVKTIRTKPFPKANFNTDNYSQCFAGNNYEFNDSSEYFLGSRYKSNRWKLGANSPLFTNTQSTARKFNEPGVYNIELIVESNDGCSDTSVKQIVVHHSPQAEFIIQDSVQCLQGNSFITQQKSTIDTADTISVYRWNFSDNISSNAVQPTKTYTDTGFFSVELIVESSNGCRDTIYDTIEVLPSPKADFTTSDICHKDTAFFNNLSINTTSAPLQYFWEFENGEPIDTNAYPSYYYKDSGQYIVKLILANTYNCKDSISKSLQIYPKPKAAFEVEGNCANNLIVFTDKTQRFGSIPTNNTWNLDDGKSATTNNITINYSNYGNKVIRLKVENQNGCKDSISQPHYISPQPRVDMVINQDQQCIKGNNFIISDATTIAEGDITQYRWLINGKRENQPQNLLSKTFSQTGNYDIKLIAQSDSGCLDSTRKSIKVYPNINLDVEILNPAQCFKKHQYLITNKSIVNGTGTIIKYTWLYSDNTTDTNQNPIQKTFTKNGEYTLTAIFETDQGCLDTFTKTLTVWYNSEPNFDTEEICLGDSAYFDNTTPQKDSIEKWHWSFGDGTTSTTENPYRKYQAAGNYKIALITTTNKGCKDTIENNYPNLVNPQPIAYFEDTLIDSYDRFTTIKFTNKSIGGTDYQWDFGDGTMETVEHPEKIYANIGQFPITLTVNNQWGCEDVYQKKILVVKASHINIPNAFTPGTSDTLNAYFKVEGVYFPKEIDMKIFNRWGTLIYHSKEIAPKWDGRYKGELVQDGVYLYAIRILDYKNKVHIYNGSLTVIK